jgi:hypothetical protein
MSALTLAGHTKPHLFLGFVGGAERVEELLLHRHPQRLAPHAQRPLHAQRVPFPSAQRSAHRQLPPQVHLSEFFHLSELSDFLVELLFELNSELKSELNHLAFTCVIVKH